MTTSMFDPVAGPAGTALDRPTGRPATAAPPPPEGALLADALSLNVLLSLGTGLALLGGAPWLDRVLGAPGWALALVGLGLVGFAAAIVVALTRPATLRRDATVVVVADVAWVLATPFVLAMDVLSPVGDGALVVTTVLVGVLVVEQLLGLVRSRGLARPGVRPVQVGGRRDVTAPADVAWAAVSDAAGYAAFATGIAASRTDGPLDQGMRRVCTDEAGNEWAETCTAVSPGHSYRMTVDTSTYPWHVRVLLDSFGMAWNVTPTASGSTIELTFAGGALLGVIGRIAMWRWTTGDPVGTILDRYATELGAD